MVLGQHCQLTASQPINPAVASPHTDSFGLKHQQGRDGSTLNLCAGRILAGLIGFSEPCCDVI